MYLIMCQLEIFSSSTSNIPGLRVSILLIPVDHGLTTVDEIIDPCNLHITTRENRDIRQDSSTASLVLKINEIISKLSKVMTLEPWDIISTGTPSGTALSLSSDLKYLRHNDIVEVEIEKIGKITNRVRVID